MSAIINKPYAVICVEWAELCEKLRNAQSLFLPKQNEYPDNKQFLEAQEKVDKALKDMEEYRKTVRISDL